MSYQVRRSSDEERVKKLHGIIFPHDEFETSKSRFYWIVTNENGDDCGFCIAADYGHGVLFFSRAGVIKKHRGKRLHYRMIKTREAHAKRNGYKHIITYTTTDNYQSFSHLIKMGYEMYNPECAYAGKDVFYFKKDLKQG